MNEKYKKATAQVSCGDSSFGTAFLISPTHAITAYHVVSKYVVGSSILLEFLYAEIDEGEREAKLLNCRKPGERGIDFAILELENPVLEIEPLTLTIREISENFPWTAFGYPSTKTKTGEVFIGDFLHRVKQHLFLYDLDLVCKAPNITDTNYVVHGASGSAVIIKDEIVAIVTQKMPGGTLGAVSIKRAKELLVEYNVPFDDKTLLTPESVSTELAKMLEVYSIKITYYLENHLKLPFDFRIKRDRDLVFNSGLNHFFEQPTWKSRIIQQISNISRKFQTSRDKDIIKKLQSLLDIKLTYEEMRSSLRNILKKVIAELPDDKTTISLKPLLFELNNLTNRRFDKVLIISGESGIGKTHFLKSILSLHKVDGVGDCSVRIPLTISDIRNKGIQISVLNSLNNYLNTAFNEVNDLDEFIGDLLKKGVNINIVFIIDGLQALLYSSANYFKDLKETIISYTKYDWVSWCISINDVDQYLVMDRSQFLKDYCFSKNGETDALNLFVNMSEINTQIKVCHDLLKAYGLDASIIEKAPQNSMSNIDMLLSNPLICHVYGSTVNDYDSEQPEICYFDFIKRYSEIKKSQMIQCSEREVSVEEIEAQNDEEIRQVVAYLMEKKTLEFSDADSIELFNGKEQCYFELRSVQLAKKEVHDITDEFESRKQIIIRFIFKLYWAYKILLQYRLSEDWTNFSTLRSTFHDLKGELLVYEILYLNSAFDKYKDTLEKEIVNVLNGDNEKELLFFFGLKTRFDCQKLIFSVLHEKEDVAFNKQEIFGLMYFLMYSNSIEPDQRCRIISRYINLIATYELNDYLESLLKQIFSRITTIKKLKKCITELIVKTDGNLSRIIGKIAAENYARIIFDTRYRMEDVIRDNVINFLVQNVKKIIESKPDHEDGVVDYFLRYLFRYLIESNTENKFILHEIMLKNNYYYIERERTIAHIIRSNTAIAYGTFYKYLNYSIKTNFKEQYQKCISDLLQSGKQMLAFHFISNTLIDQDDPKELVDADFVTFLEDINENRELVEFVRPRKDFFERNINRDLYL